MQHFCISVDWLQTFNHAEPIQAGIYEASGYTFKVQQEEQETPLFRDVFSVYKGSIKVATILQNPRTTVMHPRSTSIKITNRILYSGQYVAILYAINEALNVHYKGITRLDVCYDCNYLYDGRSVPRFIRQYVTTEPMTVGHIIRSGSSRFTVHGTRSHTSIANMTSIRWGSPHNNVTAYCYDKTLELAEIKDKPWIREMWERNGLKYDVNFAAIDALLPKERKRKTDNNTLAEYVKEHVWRFEISIKAQGTDIIDMATGQLFKLSPRYLEHEEKIRALFYIYAKKVFDFRINNGCERIRDYQKLQIFEEVPVITEKPIGINKFADTGRMEKICYNKLKYLSELYSNLAEYKRQGLQTAMDFLAELSGVKAATVKANKEAQYLNNLLGQRYMQQDDAVYLATLKRLSRIRADFDCELLYDGLMKDPDRKRERQWETMGVLPPEDFFF